MSSVVSPDVQLSGGHVLIIEDDNAMRLLEAMSLQHRGWLVSQALSGRQGLAMAAADLPEVIICDRLLPDMDGLEVIAALSKDPATASIPVVLCTSMSEAADIVHGIDAGAHDYVVKPFQIVELEVRCRAALRVSRQHRLLARSEYEFRVLTENTTELVVRCGMDRVIRYVSPSAHQMLGWHPDELVGRSAAELYHPDDVAPLHALSAGEPGDVASVTGRVVRADGSYIWVESRARFILGPDGDPEVLSAGRDVTERHHDQEARSAAESRWRTAFERAPVGMAEVGLDGRFLLVNPELCAMVGYSAEQLLTMTPVDISHPDLAGDTRQTMDDMVTGKIQHFRDEKRFQHALGRTLWCAVSAVPVYDAFGRIDHMLAHYLDISELKRVQAELQHLAGHDPLTGLLNRRGFEEALAEHIAHVDRYGCGGALLLLDLDGLKVVNDTQGHEAGDRTIGAVAELLRHRLRRTDTIARLGGDEFAIIVPRGGRDQAARIAASLVMTIRRGSEIDGLNPAVTVSIGVAMFDRPGRSAADMLAEADATMYRAKRAGRDRYAISPAAPSQLGWGRHGSRLAIDPDRPKRIA